MSNFQFLHKEWSDIFEIAKEAEDMVNVRAISTTLPIMKKSEFEKVKAPCPPIQLQNQFAEKVQVIEEQKAQAKTSLAGAEDLFNSLLQRAFKGELTN